MDITAFGTRVRTRRGTELHPTMQGRTGTVVPSPEEILDEAYAENIFIEFDDDHTICGFYEPWGQFEAFIEPE